MAYSNTAASYYRQDVELKPEDLQSQLDAEAHEAHALQQSLVKAQAKLKDQEASLQGQHALTQQAEIERLMLKLPPARCCQC